MTPATARVDACLRSTFPLFTNHKRPVTSRYTGLFCFWGVDQLVSLRFCGWWILRNAVHLQCGSVQPAQKLPDQHKAAVAVAMSGHRTTPECHT